jgi:hypothetical protein
MTSGSSCDTHGMASKSRDYLHSLFSLPLFIKPSWIRADSLTRTIESFLAFYFWRGYTEDIDQLPWDKKLRTFECQI